MNPNKEAERWETNSIYKMLRNTVSSEKKLDDLWLQYMSQSHKKRLIADSKAIELFGKDNTALYNSQKQHFAKTNHIPPNSKEVENSTNQTIASEDTKIIDNAEYYRRIEDIKIEDIEKAKAWCADTGKYMVIPADKWDRVEKSWNDYNNQIYKYQRQADSKAIELFGMDNGTLYYFCKNIQMRKDIEPSTTPPADSSEAENIIQSTTEALCERLIKSRSITESLELAYILENMTIDNPYDSIIVQNTLNQSYEKFNNNNVFESAIFNINLPYFSPEEIDSLTESVKREEFSKVWYEEYQALGLGFAMNNKTVSQWMNTVRQLSENLQMAKDNNDNSLIDKYSKALIEYGWNPEIPYNQYTQSKVNDRMKVIIQRKYTPVINLTDFIDCDISEPIVTEANKSNMKLEPIFIVLVRGNSPASFVFSNFDHGPFSHAALSLDTGLHKIYSFNFNKAFGNGFVIEDIDKYDPNLRIGLYAIFVKPKERKDISNRIKFYLDNKLSTEYGYKYLFGIATGREQKQSDYAMVCSQFVDRVMKSIGVDLGRGGDHIIPTPNDIFRTAVLNNKIYLLYEGKVKDYNQSRIDKYLKVTLQDAEYIKEAAEANLLTDSNLFNTRKLLSLNEQTMPNNHKKLYETFIKPYIQIQEVRSLPIEFDDSGALLIKNMRKLNYEDEYQKSHKLLTAYNKSSTNISGMKYELAKLWFLNSLIENDIDKSKHMKTRARILNDFYTYMAVVLEKDAEFNFADYYNSTPFCDATYRINQSTIKHIVSTIKSIALGTII